MSAVHAATLVAWRSSARAGHGGIAMASLAARVRTLLGAIDPKERRAAMDPWRHYREAWRS